MYNAEMQKYYIAFIMNEKQQAEISRFTVLKANLERYQQSYTSNHKTITFERHL